jgi:DNA-binding beta-propeller fold protein YncE
MSGFEHNSILSLAIIPSIFLMISQAIIYLKKSKNESNSRRTTAMKLRGTIRAAVFSIILLPFVILGLPGTGHAEGLYPGAEDIGQITMDKSVLWAPGKLALGGNGTLYVVDGYKDHILKFDRKGNYRGDISVAGVSAVAVAADGTLYIGSHSDYSVMIYKSGKIKGYLGSGAGEFFSIRDIAVDKDTGNIFVVDSVGNAVRVYDSSGGEQGMIAGVHLPVSIDITADEIYVLDSPIIDDAETGAPTTDSVISVFDKGLNLIGTIDENEEYAMMFRPTDITVADGKIFVSDASRKSVLVYDTTGVYLGEIKSNKGDIHTAVSVAYSSGGILYVSESETHSIQMFGFVVNEADGTVSGTLYASITNQVAGANPGGMWN